MPGIFDLPLQNPIKRALRMYELGVLSAYDPYYDLFPGKRIDLIIEALEGVVQERLGSCFKAKPNEVDKLAERVYKKADDIGTSLSTHISEEKERATREAAQMDALLEQFDLALTTMQDEDAILVSAIEDAALQRQLSRDTHHVLIEEQARMKDDMASHHDTVRELALSLEKLPELLQSNREKQALRLVNERLRYENAGYASRVEKLLDVAKDKKSENEQLKAKVEALEAKISGYVSRMSRLLEFAKAQQTTKDTGSVHTNPTFKFF